jgi:hypothetical protein
LLGTKGYDVVVDVVVYILILTFKDAIYKIYFTRGLTRDTFCCMWTPKSLSITFPEASVAFDFCSKSCPKSTKIHFQFSLFTHETRALEAVKKDKPFSHCAVLPALHLQQHKPHKIPLY